MRPVVVVTATKKAGLAVQQRRVNATDIIRQPVNLLTRIIHPQKDNIFRRIDQRGTFLKHHELTCFAAPEIQRRKRLKCHDVAEYVTHLEQGEIAEQQVVKYRLFHLVRCETTTGIAPRHHVTAGIQHPTVLGVKVRELRQCQAVNRQLPVVVFVVIPDVMVVRAGGQHRFRLTKGDCAATCGRECFFRHA